MASNPIQKKVRNAGLLGAAITLLIMGIVVAFLLIQIDKVKQEKEALNATIGTVFKLVANVKSGQVITSDMILSGSAETQYIPNNAITDASMFYNYSLTDGEGNRIYTDNEGMYIIKNCEYMEVYKDEQQNKYYTYSNKGERQELTNLNQSQLSNDEFGTYLVRKTEGKTRIYKEEATDEYYVLKIKYDTNAQGTVVREKEYIKVLGSPLIAKIDMNANTVLTLDMLSQGTAVTDDVRKQEYNAIVLPVDLITGDYVDIRVQLPSGQDYIVLSKKVVELPFINGMESQNTIWLNLSEDEILSMSCAIVESYRINGAKLYATKYADPGIQDAAIPTYPISKETLALIKEDPNVKDYAEQQLANRYKATLENLRETLNNELDKPENSSSNVPGKINESIVKTQEERKDYLQSLY